MNSHTLWWNYRLLGWGMNNGDSGMSRYTSNPDLVAGAPISLSVCNRHGH